MHAVVLLLLMSISGNMSVAQSLKSLIVRDAESQKTLSGALVMRADSSMQQLSDGEGKVLLKASAGDVFFVHLLGYETQRVQLGRSDKSSVFLKISDQYLDEIIVEGFEAGKSLSEQSASIGYISAREIQNYSGSSLVPAMNNEPGVRMEERSPGSYRLSIRGSLLRAPFGIRNVKVYWNGIPFTDAGGSTPLNTLNVSSIGSAEIIKGPGSSLYGAGTGGVVLLHPQPASSNLIDLDVMTGSFYTQKYELQSFVPINNGSLQSGISYFGSEGYREHSAMQRTNAWMQYRKEIGKGLVLKSFLLGSDFRYQIPGGLNLAQFEENPRAARPESIPQNSSIHTRNLWLGGGYDWNHNENFFQTLNLYGQLGDFDHPFITDYKQDRDAGAGGRWAMGYHFSLQDWKIQAQGGVEGQYSRKQADNFGNRQGIRDTLRFSDDLQISNLFGFAQLSGEWKEKLTITAGMSINALRQDINRLQDVALDSAYRDVISYGGIASPRLALGYKVLPGWLIHANWSNGFSPPTIEEVRTNEGSINTSLRPEIGVNREIGIKGHIANRRLQVDFTFFNLQLRETIVNFVNQDGVVLFRNAGATRQNGIENLIRYELVKSSNRFIKTWTIQHSLTRNWFVFQDYERGGNDFSGNRLTGVPDWISVWNTYFEIGKGIYWTITYNYTSAIPLNDANTIFGDAYHLVQLLRGYRFVLKNKVPMELYAGVDNLFNQTYSLGNDLNAFGGRFFQTAPGRNYFVGLKAGISKN